MSVRVETLIEGGDFDYDIDNIQELDHFDIGEEEDPEEVTAGEAGVWANPLERVPLSRQKPRRVPKRSGRKRKGEVIRIPKRQPPREAKRIKSYQQFDTFEDDEGEEDQEDVEEEDSDPEIMDEHGEPSTSKTFRVFVRKDGTGMHYDWPIYSDTAISLKDVVSIISSEASGIEKICSDGTIPQEFTNTGTFICQMGDTVGRRKEEICNDGLGTWQSAQMFVRKYIVGGERQRPQMTQKNDHNLKIVCEQFIHPGTDSRGDFLRKIYTGFDKDEHMMSYVVISYEWMGQPHPLTVYEEDDSSSSPTSHGDKIQALQDQMTWKKCSNPDDQVPILARHACDFSTATGILLSPDKFNGYGKSVPQHVEECISFVLHVEECGGPRALFVDGNEWQRPSGSGRFYRITYPPPPTHPQKENGEEIGIWNIERTPWNCSGANSDIQVICRRYNGQKYSSSFGFVRKIYLLKILPSCPPEIANQLVNKDLAVVSYSYRNSTVPTFIEHPIGNGKLPNGEMVGEEVEVVNGELMMIEEEPEMRELVERVEMKRKTNGQRLMDILSRIHRFDEIRKKAHWQVDTTEIDELVQFGAILENSINHH